MKILALVKTVDVTGISAINHLRAVGPLTYLSREPGFAVGIAGFREIQSAIDDGRLEELLDVDIVVMSRLFGESQDETLGIIRQFGAITVFDTDDDLTGRYRDTGHADEFIDMCALSDYVTVSTDNLASELGQYTSRPPIVLKNHLDMGWFADESMRAERQVPGISIGFVGTATHDQDWCHAADAAMQISDEYPGVTLSVACDTVPDYLYEHGVAHIEPVPYAMYPQLLRQFDIVLCAIDPDDPFNWSKSSVKALECMGAARELSDGRVGGAIPVCTNALPYKGVVNGHNGILCHNDRWYDALKGLVENTDRARDLAVTGHNWIKANRNIETRYVDWGKAYQEMLGGGVAMEDVQCLRFSLQ